jgi:hypothetical protein
VPAEAARLGLAARRHHAALDRGRQRRELRGRLEFEQQHARAARGRQAPGRAQAQREGSQRPALRAHLREQRLHLAGRDVSQEAQRHVHRLRAHPADRVAARTLSQRRRQLGGRAARGLAQLDRKEGPNSGLMNSARRA